MVGYEDQIEGEEYENELVKNEVEDGTSETIETLSNIRTGVTNNLQHYFNRIGEVKLLSREEEVELGKRIEQGDKTAADELATANLRLVVSIAKRYDRVPGVDMIDLIQEGNIGLL